MQLIITEKPLVAGDIAKAIGAPSIGRGAYKNGSYTVISLRGHLVELFEPRDYDPDLKKWDLATLPIVPREFKYKPIEASIDKYNAVAQVLKKGAFDKVIVATDAGREGELIARLILGVCNVDTSNALRFWTSEALTPEAVKRELGKLRPLAEFDEVYKQGRARQLSDWIVGINCTRAASIVLGDSVFSFGRVQTAVMAQIYTRTKEHHKFDSTTYYEILGRFRALKTDPSLPPIPLEFLGKYKNDDKNRYADIGVANEILKSLKGIKAFTIQKFSSEEKKEKPPLLLNLTGLQRIANKQLGLSSKKTVEIAQILYEKYKCLSYPRTPSRHLSESDHSVVIDILGKISSVYPDKFSNISQDLVNAGNKRVFDATKVEDHYALLPLDNIPPQATDQEIAVYLIVVDSFAKVFMADYQYKRITFDVQGDAPHAFECKGREIISLGWKELEQKKKSEEEQKLPQFSNNTSVEVVETEVLNKITAPPKLFTEAGILAAMENPSKHTKVSDEYKKIPFGIGTAITRSEIIEILLSRGYITRNEKNQNLESTKKAEHLMKFIQTQPHIVQFIDFQETAHWEEVLSRDPDALIDKCISFTREMVENLSKTNIGQHNIRQPVGKCPICKDGDVREGKKNYYCSMYTDGCKFIIWKEVAGATLTGKDIAALLKGGVTSPKNCTKKNGDRFEASLKLDEEKKVTFVFSVNNDTAPVGKCPICKDGDVREEKKKYYCSRYRDGCKFSIWKEVTGAILTRKDIVTLLKGGITPPKKCTRRDGEKFEASLELNEEKKVVFVSKDRKSTRKKRNISSSRRKKQN